MLFQEYLKDEPFWMLVACCLVNKTKWTQAQPAFDEIRSRWPTPEALSEAAPDDVYGVVWQLGLGDRRSKQLVALARSYIRVKPASAYDVMTLAGCGKYASAAGRSSSTVI